MSFLQTPEGVKMSRTSSSFKARTWDLPTFTEGRIDDLVARGANALTAPILAARGHAPDDLPDFLSPRIRRMMPDPGFFLDMDKAAARLVSAIESGEKMTIWSDYDVDGATSAATLARFMRYCGHDNHDIHIPDRITEGYGPNTEGLLRIKADGHSLVCILDSGTVAFDPLEAARDAALDVVVVDHHAAESEIPPALAVVNPNRADQPPGYGHLCAVGMTFILVIAVNLKLRQRGFFNGHGSRPATPPDLMSYLDLVALGTICDVVPLVTLNRAFVMRGLPYLSDRGTPGIEALARVSRAPALIDTRACGFALGPRLNAGGRIGDPGAGTALLLETDPDIAEDLARTLDRLNIERQEMEHVCTREALGQMPSDFVPGTTRALALSVVDAHEGIVGISAARLKDSMDAPAFVLAPTPDGMLKGSGRSVPGFDMGAAIIAARKSGLLSKGGGHAMAGGITLREDMVEPFIAFMNARIARSDYARNGIVSHIDCVIPVEKATPGLIDAAGCLAPFGMGNPGPRFVIRGAYLAEVEILKEKHIRCRLQSPETRDAGKTIEGLIWNAADTTFAQDLLDARGAVLDVLGSLEISEWKGRRRVQMKIEDARYNTESSGQG